MDPAATLEALISAKASKVDVAQVAEALIDMAGGPVGLARHLWQAYEEETTNKMVKSRILLAITGLIEAVSTEQQARDPVPQMSTEELAGAMRDIQQRYGQELSQLQSG